MTKRPEKPSSWEFDKKQEQIRCAVQEELRKVSLPPLQEGFYQSVQQEIHNRSLRAQVEPESEQDLLIWLGNACWKSLPACCVLCVLMLAYYLFQPLEPIPDLILSEETAIWMELEGPNPAALFYQLFPSQPEDPSKP